MQALCVSYWGEFIKNLYLNTNHFQNTHTWMRMGKTSRCAHYSNWLEAFEIQPSCRPTTDHQICGRRANQLRLRRWGGARGEPQTFVCTIGPQRKTNRWPPIRSKPETYYQRNNRVPHRTIPRLLKSRPYENRVSWITVRVVIQWPRNGPLRFYYRCADSGRVVVLYLV